MAVTVGLTEVTTSGGAGSGGAGAGKVTAVLFDAVACLRCARVRGAHPARGPWGVLHDASEADARIEPLDEPVGALA